MLGSAGVVVLLFNCVCGWSLLPSASNWPQILSSFPSEESVEPYVKIYVAPYWELQRAERNHLLSTEALRSGLDAAASLMLSVTSDFSISDEIFDKRDATLYKQVLERATAKIFNTSNADVKRLASVFSAGALQRFLFQRLDDMIVCSSNADQMNQMVADFNQYVAYYQSQIESMSDSKLRNLIARNLDMVEISRYSARHIRERYNTDMTLSDLRDLRYELHSLGNSAKHAVISSVCAVALAVACAMVL